MSSTPKPKPSPASPRAPEHKRPSQMASAAHAGFARVPFAGGRAPVGPFQGSPGGGPITPPTGISGPSGAAYTLSNGYGLYNSTTQMFNSATNAFNSRIGNCTH